MKDAKKNLASKTDVNNTLDLGDKHRKKQRNFKLLIQLFSWYKLF